MPQVVLGLRANWHQFALLLIINVFVGGMIGLERTILPQLAASEFGLSAKTAILSFIVVFGITKAIANYFAGTLANQIGRKQLLIWGWIIGLPVPVLLILAPNWGWVVFANGLLGVHQGLTWSSTVVMKIDLVGQKNRGLAMGLNESSGYLAVGAVAFASGWIAGEFGVRPYPFYMGLFFALAGLLMSVLLVKDTVQYVQAEGRTSTTKPLGNIFRETTWSHPNLGAISQAGLVNNLNDGMIWGLLPIFLAAKGFGLNQTAQIVAIYPAVWGLGQLFTGKMADLFPKKPLLFWGMFLQGAAIVGMAFSQSYGLFAGLSIVLGLGTAVVYPTFLAAIADNTHPDQRAGSIGVFRLWRDMGYAIGAILTGIVADIWSLEVSIVLIGTITLGAAVLVALRMNHQNEPLRKD